MRHAAQIKKQARPNGRGSHGRWLHELLLRREEMERSRIGSPRMRKGRWDKRCLCPEGLCLCFICWQDMQLSALCQQRMSIKRSRLHLGATAAALPQGDANNGSKPIESAVQSYACHLPYNWSAI